MCTDVLWRIRDAVRRKRFEKCRTSSWLLLHDHAPAHRPVLIKDFLAKNHMTTLEYPPYSIDLTAAESYLFPRLKSALKGWLFCGVTDIKSFDGKAEMAFTKQLPGMCPTTLQSLTEVYICTRGLFWRKFNLYDCTVLYFLEIKRFWEHFEATMYDVRGDRVATSWSQIRFILLQPALWVTERS